MAHYYAIEHNVISNPVYIEQQKLQRGVIAVDESGSIYSFAGSNSVLDTTMVVDSQ
jgi:hypothetical protein